MSKVSKASKKTSKKTLASVEKPAALAAVPKPVVALGSDDALTVRSAQSAWARTQQRLGELREKYIAEENLLLEKNKQARETLETVIRTLAQKHEVDLTSGQWSFNLETMTFSRIQG